MLEIKSYLSKFAKDFKLRYFTISLNKTEFYNCIRAQIAHEVIPILWVWFNT